ncbi:hypothetical protein [Chryseobacterium sp. 5_R23647]|uniref:hypothetical protein n=1 Tax=Chryseobacterium sp. 5_R23647 TaxID=2258964 RepID=UPI000E26EFD1|nr:hypothetical protein [Chryseobacterium sp. 5_R23647]REC40462.1 hypothetical protein DRF69_18380 [Chryseobacterium sp. 5_R23647]
MELHEIDKKILAQKEKNKNELKRLQNLKKDAEKKAIESASLELLKRLFGDNWIKFYEKIKTSPETHIEIIVNGNKFDNTELN